MSWNEFDSICNEAVEFLESAEVTKTDLDAIVPKFLNHIKTVNEAVTAVNDGANVSHSAEDNNGRKKFYMTKATNAFANELEVIQKEVDDEGGSLNEENVQLLLSTMLQQGFDQLTEAEKLILFQKSS